MPLPSSIVDHVTEPRDVLVDTRWTMAYAAAIGDPSPCYRDTTRSEGVVAHPLFPVCVEWPVVLDHRRTTAGALTGDERARGVHATHDLFLHRVVRPDEMVRTTATVTRVERRRPGAYELIRLDTVGAGGDPIATTHMGSLFLGVDVDGPDRVSETAPPAPDPTGAVAHGTVAAELDVGADAAHVYTECARIWNPIHTDRAVALAAGLPDVILHGTATLAMAVSATLRTWSAPEPAVVDPTRVRRVSCRFGAMVTMPTTLTLRLDRDPVGGGAGHVRRGEVRAATGEPVIRDLAVTLEPGARQ